MAKQLNVNLGFTADTSQAKAQVQDLQRQLTNLASTPLKMNGKISDDIWEASAAAAELKVHLENAVNTKTGNLDFTRLNDSLNKSKKHLTDYAEQLVKLGPEGQKAFMSLASSITAAEVPIKRSNALLTEMWTSLKNTARWQISSSILHGFIGAIQSAYGYAQDLNESLNNIRIVTNASIDDMSRFASEANRAAKALSTTTTEYTNASLIYYQQGLSDEEVKKRTDITIKMANAAGQSAEKVSDQLTAVWNNFYDGTKSLEHYADVMTALGAKTASSTDEIAGGLEKFAAVADTIGLSYEYAASALATITSNTRESEEVVGTALKTLFSRIQGLQLGETLEDGVDLNKYSAALKTVGINILDANGELKKMDIILDEMGSKWDTLSKSQQVALAETVAGVRQYNQLVALMDNWNDGDSDSFQANLDTAKNSKGALQEQSDIYAEGWEAASNRVRAALEGIYSKLIDDDAFIGALNVIEKIVTYFDNLITTVGGLSGVLTTLGAMLTKVFSNQIASSISNMAYSIQMLTPAGRKAVQDAKSQALTESADIMKNLETGGAATTTASSVYEQQLKLQQELIDNQGRMNEGEQKRAQILMQQLSLQGEQAIEAARALDIAKQQQEAAFMKVHTKAAASANNQGIDFNSKAVTNYLKQIKEATEAARTLDLVIDGIGDSGQASANDLEAMGNTLRQLHNQQLIDPETESKFQVLLNKLQYIDSESEDWQATLAEIRVLTQDISSTKIDNAAQGLKIDKAPLEEYSQAILNTANKSDVLKKKTDNVDQSVKKTSKSFKEAQGHQKTWADNLVTCANSALSLISALQMIGGIVDTLEDPNMSGWEKFLSIGSSLLMMISMIISAVTGLQGVLVGTSASGAAAAAGIGATGASAGAATGPVAGFGAALNMALGPIGWVALALTALVAVVAVVISSLDTAAEAAQKNFDRMAADAETAANTLEEAKSAYTNLQDTIASYQDARSKIDELTEGTEEFKQAVIEANNYARQLIETYQVASTFNPETGLIEINQKDLDEATAKYQQRLEDARINNVAAQTNKLAAKNDLANAKLAEKNDTTYWERFSSYTGAYMAMGGMAGSTMGPIGTVVGIAGGLLAGLGQAWGEGIDQESQNKAQIAALEKLQDAYIKNGGNFELAFKELSASDQSLINALGMTNSALEAQCAATAANTAAIIENNKQTVDNNFSDNAAYANSKNKTELNTVLANKLKEKEDALYDSTYADGQGMIDKTVQQEYADMMGYTWVKDKSGNLGVYSKGDGSADFTVSDETARRALAQKEALKQLEADVAKYDEMLNRIGSMGDDIVKGAGDILLSMAGGTGPQLADATIDGVDALLETLNEYKENEAFTKATEFISDKEAQALGYKNAVDYCEALQAGLNQYKIDMTKIKNSVAEGVSTGFMEIEGLTKQNAKVLANSLNDAFMAAGADTANLLDQIFVGAGDQADELSAILANVDWGDPAAVAKLNQTIREQKINVDTTSAAWQTYVQTMSAVGLAIGGPISQLERLRTSLQNVESVKGLALGDIISDAEYEKLIKINPEIKKFFGIAADGYKFVGDKGSLINLMLGEDPEDQIELIKSEYTKLSKIGSILNNKDWFNGENAIDDINVILQRSKDAMKITNMDTALSYFGVTREGMQQALDYVTQFTDASGNMIVGANEKRYTDAKAMVQQYYTELSNMSMDYENGIFDSIQGEEFWASSLARGIKDLSDYALKGAISWETYYKYFKQVLDADLGALSEVQEVLLANGKLTQEQSAYLDDLEAQWPELAAIADRGSQSYLNALEKIEDAMQQMRLMDLNADVAEVEIDINSDIDTFEDQLEELTKRKREVFIQVVADAKDAYDDFDESASQLKAAAGLIGEGYTVARDDIDSLKDVFPGILKDATTTEEGLIQLSKTTVDTEIANAKTRIATEKTVTNEDLTNQQKLITAKIESNKRIIALLTDRTKNSLTLSDTEISTLKTWEAGLTDYEAEQLGIRQTNKETEAGEEIESSNEVVEAEKVNANQSSIAWASAYTTMMQNAVTAANLMITAANEIGAANARAAGESYTPYKLLSEKDIPNLFGEKTPLKETTPKFDPMRRAVSFDENGNVVYEEILSLPLKKVNTTTTKTEETEEIEEKPTEPSELQKLLDALATNPEDSEADKKLQAIIEALEKENVELQGSWEDLEALKSLNTESWLKELDNIFKGVGQSTSTSGGGGSGKDPKQLEMLKDTVDVYADIDTEIDNINEKLKDQKRITQHAETEEEKLASLEEEAKILEELNEAYKEKQAIAKDTAADLKSELQQAVSNSDMGIQLEFDNDTLKNQVAIFTQLEAEVNAARQAVNTAVTEEQRKAAEEQLAAIEAASDEIRRLIQQYLKTIALLQSVENTIADTGYDIADTYAASQGTTNTSSSSSGSSDSGPSLEEIQQAYYKKISSLLKADMAKLERQLGRLDFQLERIADDFYSMAEAAELMTQKLPVALNSLERYEDFYNQISDDYNKMNITSEDYQTGLEETYNGIVSQLKALVKLDKEMMHYYEDTLAAGVDELAKYTDQMKHLNSVLDHYHNIVTMINGEDEYESIGIILESKAYNLQNQMDIAVANYEMLLSQQAAIRAKYDAAEDEAQRELHKAELDAITATVDEAHETMLAKTKEWAKAQKSILENSMAQAAKQLETTFTNGMGFDTLSSSLNRLSSISDEYYTKTNQIYETQKMLNNLQQEIDKTTNTAAKARLKSYASEIEKLREKNKLSKLDLSIAKAKYDVLLAEIALEEAQNAKATVRLQRDSEGNYGYVYTADQNQIAQAEQKLADAQNALYNVSLEGANNYGQKILELQQQLADDLVSLEEARAAGQFQTDEAYYAAKELLIAEYNELFEAYSDSYNVALLEDLSIQQEAWITTYDDLIQESENWQEHVLEYTTNCENSYTHYREIVEANSEVIQNALNNIRDTVGDITAKSDELADTVLNEVIPAMDTELTQVGKVTEAFAAQRSTIQDLIGYYDALCRQIDTAIYKVQQLNAEKAGEVEGDGTGGGGSGDDLPGSKTPTKNPVNPTNPTSPTEPTKISHDEMKQLVTNMMVHGTYGNDPHRTNNILGTGKYTAEDRAAAQKIVNDIATNNSDAWHKGTNWDSVLDSTIKKYGYATGGYTGAWGPEGRLAFLHEKELILNKQDTANFLVATQVLRDIAKMIDINSLHSQISNLTSIGMTSMKADTLEQQVSIEAHFPNVTDKNEIEQALNNLVNTAAQYANRKF